MDKQLLRSLWSRSTTHTLQHWKSGKVQLWKTWIINSWKKNQWFNEWMFCCSCQEAGGASTMSRSYIKYWLIWAHTTHLPLLNIKFWIKLDFFFSLCLSLSFPLCFERWTILRLYNIPQLMNVCKDVLTLTLWDVQTEYIQKLDTLWCCSFFIWSQPLFKHCSVPSLQLCHAAL